MKIILSISLAFFLFTISFSQELGEGSLVKSIENDEIYLIFNRELHHIFDMDSFNNLFIENPKLEIYPAVELEMLPRGDTLKGVRLIKGSGAAIYLQYNYVKLHISTPEAFNTLQFDWSKIVVVNDEELFQYTTKKPIIINSSDTKEKDTWGYY